MHKVKSKLIYDSEAISKKHASQLEWKCYAFCALNDDLDDYYRWFIKRKMGIELIRPMRHSHFSVINDKMNKTLYQEKSIQYKNRVIEFTVTDLVRSNISEWWIKVESEDAIALRKDFGLGRPYWGFHITIGAVKESELHISDYFIRELMRQERSE